MFALNWARAFAVCVVAAIALLLLSSSVFAATPKVGVGPDGLTSAHLCSLVTAAQARALLNGQAPYGGSGASHGNPQSNLGAAGCTWAEQGGGNDSISMSAYTGAAPSNPCSGITGGVVVRKAGWAGCWLKGNGLYVYAGVFYISFSPQLGSSVPAALEPAMDSVVTSVVKELHV